MKRNLKSRGECETNLCYNTFILIRKVEDTRPHKKKLEGF